MDKLLLVVNSISCGLIASRLIFFNKCGTTYRPFISLLAYLVIIVTASVPIRTLFHDYPEHDISETLLNTLLCIAVFSVRGNLAQLFWRLKHE